MILRPYCKQQLPLLVTAKHYVRLKDCLLLYLRLVHTREPSVKPVVRSKWLSVEKDTLRMPPRWQEWQCSSMYRSCRWSIFIMKPVNKNMYKNSKLKWALTMDSVSLICSKPSRPTEANHKWWGDRMSEAGPSIWALTSCSGFSWITCSLEKPSVTWEDKSEFCVLI